MKILDTTRLRIMALFKRSALRAEMDEELLSHIEHRADDLERSGMSRAEAERRARVEFGGRERYKEESYDALGGNFIESLVQDVRFALRVLRKSQGFTFAAVVTLALAIGANAVVFGLMDGLILRPLNVPQSESLYGTNYGTNPAWQSYPNYLDLRESQPQFRGSGSFQHGAGCGSGCRQRSVCRERVCNHRELLRRATHSSVSWAFLPRLR